VIGGDGALGISAVVFVGNIVAVDSAVGMLVVAVDSLVAVVVASAADVKVQLYN
jgi:hypothetical protein